VRVELGLTHNEANFSPDFWVVIATFCATLLSYALGRERRSEGTWLSLALVCLAGLSISLWTLAIGPEVILSQELVAALVSAALVVSAAILVGSALYIKKIWVAASPASTFRRR
jgi:hypothetical protein